MMTASDVHEVVSRLKAAGIVFWLDGGWGVDALVGYETRDHDDLDVVVSREKLDEARVALAPLGFAHSPNAEPGLPARFVVRAPHGRQVDFHAVVFDEHGHGHQELGDGSWCLYPAGGLTAFGTVAGHRVPCVTAELQVRHHLGFEPSNRDRADMQALASQLEIELPPQLA